MNGYVADNTAEYRPDVVPGETRNAQARTATGQGRWVARWFLGAGISSALMMIGLPYFMTSLRVYEWSAELNDYVIKAGYVHRNRNEGWSTTHYGPYGLNGTAGHDPTGGPVVLIWGDSYVEAHQVNDEDKVASQVTKMLSSRTGRSARAFAAAHAYWSVADYYFRIPQYEALLNPACHFIVLAEHGLKDLCADGETFRLRPHPEFVRRPVEDPRKIGVMAALDRWHLANVTLVPWKAVRRVAGAARTARFTPGRYEPSGDVAGGTGCMSLPPIEDSEALVASWNYALDMLRARTNRPLVLVAVPEVPSVRHGTVCCDHPQKAWSVRLAELCAARGIGYIDMAQILADDYRLTGKFCRGFHNGRPGSGHLNARGHYLLAQQICTYLQNHSDLASRPTHALHAD